MQEKEKQNFLSSDLVTFPSRAAERIFLEALNIEDNKKQKTEIVYNGIDIRKVKNNKHISRDLLLFRKKYSLKKTDVLIGIVGSINKSKGQRELILAMPIIIKSIPSVKLLIVGDDNSKNHYYCSEIKTLCNNMSLNNYIIFTGFQKNMMPIYSLLHLLVSLSQNESFGRVLMVWVVIARMLSLRSIFPCFLRED